MPVNGKDHQTEYGPMYLLAWKISIFIHRLLKSASCNVYHILKLDLKYRYDQQLD